MRYLENEFNDEKIKVMLAEPTIGNINHNVYDNRKDFCMEIARFEARSKYKFFTCNTARLMIQYAREILCDEALKAGMDYILFIDDDMTVPHDLFEHLVQIDADIVAPLATSRVYPYPPVVYELEEIQKPDGERYLKTKPVENIKINTIFEVQAVGFGVVLLKTSLLKKVKKPWFFVNQAIGEDIFFCMNARKEYPELKIMVNAGVNVGHVSEPKIITYRDYLKHRENKN